VRLELRAWQGEVEKLKEALERSEEHRVAEGRAAEEKLQAKEVRAGYRWEIVYLVSCHVAC
jgi:hypothetical protein